MAPERNTSSLPKVNPVVEEELTDKKDVEAAEDEAELVLAAASPRTVTRDRPKVGMVAWEWILEVARTAVNTRGQDRTNH